MRYVWRGSAKLHTSIYAITRRADISDHLLARGQKNGMFHSRRLTNVGGETPRREQVHEPPTPFDVVMSEFDREMVDIIEPHRRDGQEMESRQREVEAGENTPA